MNTKKELTRRLFSRVMMMVIFLGALSTQVIEAATIGVTIDPDTLTTMAGAQVNFAVRAVTDDEGVTSGTFFQLDDGGNGGFFYNGNLSGECNSTSPDADKRFSLVRNQAVCYANDNAGVYTVTASLYGVSSGSEQLIGTATATITVLSDNAPTPPVATLLSSTSVNLNWDAPANPAGANIFYTIQISAASAEFQRFWEHQEQRVVRRLDDSEAVISSPSFAGKRRWFRIVPHLDGVAIAPLPAVEVNFPAVDDDTPATTTLSVSPVNNVTVVKNDDGTITASWDALTNTSPDSYLVELSKNNFGAIASGTSQVLLRQTDSNAIILSQELALVASDIWYMRVRPWYGNNVTGPASTSQIINFSKD